MQEIILIVYLIVSIALIGIILLQQGKGAEMGASFGAGGANTVFGSAGSGNVLTKTTTILAILFFGIALAISYVSTEPVDTSDDILDEVPAQVSTQEKEVSKTVNGMEAEIAPDQKTVLESEVADAIEGAKATASDVQEKAKETLNAVESKATDVKDTVVEKAQDAKTKAVELKDKTIDGAAKKVDDAKDALKKAADDTEKKLKDSSN